MTLDVIVKSEYLEYHNRGSRNQPGTAYEPVLIKCPACGVEFDGGTSRVAHLSTHSASDFGL